jgi:hypothetical protein
MKKHFLNGILILLAIYLILLAIYVQAQQIPVETLRKEYHNLHTDSVATVNLYSKLSKIEPSDNLTRGYKGATMTAMAKYVKGKAEKIKLFNTGKKLLEDAVNADKENTELRFLRYTVQTNAPKALGYNTRIEEDKQYLLSNYDKLDNAIVKSRISEYLLSCGKLNDEEKKKVKPNGK